MFNISFVRIFALTLIIFAGCLITAKAQIVTKGLVSWWSFDKTSIEDENVKDIYGEHDGIIFGEPKIVKGKRNEALDFGEGNNYVEVKAKGDLVTMDGSYTVLLWAFSRSGGGLFYNYGDEGNAQIEIRQDPEAVQMAIRDNSKNEMNVRPETEMEKWNYLGYVWDSKTGTLTGHVNGEKAGEAESELGDIDNSSYPVHIGANVMWEGYLNGIIDEVCVYSRALNETELKQNFKASVEETLFAVVTPSDKLSITWGRIKALEVE